MLYVPADSGTLLLMQLLHPTYADVLLAVSLGQKMADLPEDRLGAAPPFTNSTVH